MTESRPATDATGAKIDKNMAIKDGSCVINVRAIRIYIPHGGDFFLSRLNNSKRIGVIA